MTEASIVYYGTQTCWLSRNLECPCLSIIYRFVYLVSLYHNVHIMGLFFQSSALAAPPCLPRWPHRKPDLTLHSSLVVLSFLPSVVRAAAAPTLQNP